MSETLTRTTVLLIDGHKEVLAALSRRLKKVGDLKVVGETGSSGRALDMAARLRPDLIIADFGAGGAYAAARCARLQQACPDSQIVVFTPYADESMRQMYADAGAAACLLKDIGFDGLVRELRMLIAKADASRACQRVRRGPESAG